MKTLRKKMLATSVRNIAFGVASGLLFWNVLSRNAVIAAAFIFVALSL